MNVTLPRRGDVLALTPDALDDDGLATTRITVGERRFRVHVRDAVPGDVVEARVESRFRDEIIARVVTLVTPSPDRQPEPCAHRNVGADSAPCGGCALQAMRYEAQLHHKRERVTRQLDAHGFRGEVRPTLAAPIVFRHRHKMEFSFGRDRADQLALGFHPSGYRWEIVTVTDCRMISAWSAAFLPTVIAAASEAGLDAFDPRVPDAPGRVLRNLVVREAQRTGDRLFELITTSALPLDAGRALVKTLSDRAGDAVSGWVWTMVVAERGQPTRHTIVHSLGRPTLDEVLHLPGDRKLRLGVHPRAFFQPHPRAAELLLAEVIARLGDAGGVDARIADLYCGTGTLALSVAPFVASVVGVELVPEAVDDARANAERAGIDNVTFIAGDVALVLADPAHAARFANLDGVLLDPPRSGLLPQAFDALARLAPRRIIYVSCNPTTLGRDLAALGKVGYTVEGPVQPVDLFPQTPHVESVTTLVRATPSA